MTIVALTVFQLFQFLYKKKTDSDLEYETNL